MLCSDASAVGGRPDYFTTDKTKIDRLKDQLRPYVKGKGTQRQTPFPSTSPSKAVTLKPTARPTLKPTAQPTVAPTLQPTPQPTHKPTPQPTFSPTHRVTSLTASQIDARLFDGILTNATALLEIMCDRIFTCHVTDVDLLRKSYLALNGATNTIADPNGNLDFWGDSREVASEAKRFYSMRALGDSVPPEIGGGLEAAQR